MAVQSEQYVPSQVAMTGVAPGVVDDIYRRKDGTWMSRMKMDLEIVLPDGRMIRWNRHLVVPATEQVGRRRAM